VACGYIIFLTGLSNKSHTSNSEEIVGDRLLNTPDRNNKMEHSSDFARDEVYIGQ
jgi:hypothetical protein